jgi:hypothetical protein
VPRFPASGFLSGAALIALGVLLIAALFHAHLEVPLRLLLLAPALLMLMVGSAIAIFSLASFRWQRKARLRGKRSQGFVESVAAARGKWRVRARWRNDQGREYHFDSARVRARPAIAEGERVVVWIDEADPFRYHFVDLESPAAPESRRS